MIQKWIPKLDSFKWFQYLTLKIVVPKARYPNFEDFASYFFVKKIHLSGANPFFFEQSTFEGRRPTWKLGFSNDT